jgi:hypothetical protein
LDRNHKLIFCCRSDRLEPFLFTPIP